MKHTIWQSRRGDITSNMISNVPEQMFLNPKMYHGVDGNIWGMFVAFLELLIICSFIYLSNILPSANWVVCWEVQGFKELLKSTSVWSFLLDMHALHDAVGMVSHEHVNVKSVSEIQLLRQISWQLSKVLCDCVRLFIKNVIPKMKNQSIEACVLILSILKSQIVMLEHLKQGVVTVRNRGWHLIIDEKMF
jgi:hypothetical protein